MSGRRGQQISEYAIVLGIASLVAATMQLYVWPRLAGVLVAVGSQILGTQVPPTSTATSSSVSSTGVHQNGQWRSVHTEITETSSGTSRNY
jgi:hypothetical protein